jgi:hypothetical protein
VKTRLLNIAFLLSTPALAGTRVLTTLPDAQAAVDAARIESVHVLDRTATPAPTLRLLTLNAGSMGTDPGGPPPYKIYLAFRRQAEMYVHRASFLLEKNSGAEAIKAVAPGVYRITMTRFKYWECMTTYRVVVEVDARTLLADEAKLSQDEFEDVAVASSVRVKEISSVRTSAPVGGCTPSPAPAGYFY